MFSQISYADCSITRMINCFEIMIAIHDDTNSKGLIELLKQGKAQLIDIRFPEEYLAWKVEPSINIPLNELPGKLSLLDKSKVIVTACPHKDRAIIAMVYLRSKGIKAKYLTDGLIGLAENLRGDNARSFVDELERLKP